LLDAVGGGVSVEGARVRIAACEAYFPHHRKIIPPPDGDVIVEGIIIRHHDEGIFGIGIEAELVGASHTAGIEHLRYWL
jgi:hypothetical protein